MKSSDDGLRPLLVELPIRVKTYDIDFVGHVNNIVYVRWLEDLRLHLLDVHYPLEPLRKQGIVPIVVTTNVHYRQGIHLSDQLVRAQMWIDKLERATFILSAEFSVNGEVRCTARQRGTFVEMDRMRPVRIPEGLRSRFDQERVKAQP